jgi:uncharacterized membrane protein
MYEKQTVLKLAVTSVLALAGTAFVASASATEHDREQCAGLIKAGKNDCATSTNKCHGHVAVDSSPEAWIYLPKGTCERLVGGRLVKVKEPTPGKQ